MNVLQFSILALTIAFGVAYLVLRRAQQRIPPLMLAPGESVPTTAIQRLARNTLLLASGLALAAGGIVAVKGASAFWQDDHIRWSVTGLWIAIVGVYALYARRIAVWTARDNGTVDERDRAIVASAPAGQAPALIVTLAAWMIGLTETFSTTHLVPSVFLYLLFWSCLVVSILTLLAGVVLGYRRQ
jgi:hypothetical protein